ncbi:MAG: HAMP domain-containing histidine kinase [Puniceicoccales bacterium]|jgi:signal transduction histidine kinase|nr:HAMP domain-containing histidine kinase [Puniceicoccales bacterium]
MKILKTEKTHRFLTTFAIPFLAALVVAGTVAILALLNHFWVNDLAERQRLRERSDATSAAHAKLAAETMEALFADVQSALLGTLNAIPREGTLPFLVRWSELNAFVSIALPVNANGALEPGKYWPVAMSREYLEAVRTPGHVLHEKTIPPGLSDWLAKTPWHPGAVVEKKTPSKPQNTTPFGEVLRERLRTAAAQSPHFARNNPEPTTFPDSVSGSGVNRLPEDDNYATTEFWAERRRRLGLPFTERTGWDGVPGKLFLWRMCDDDMVLVVSVNLQQLANVFAGVLPATIENGPAYSLATDATGNARVTQARDEFSSDFPIHPELLPGWAIRVAQKRSATDLLPSQTLFYGSAATVIFAAAMAILLLFLFQRRMHENERTALVADYASHEIRTHVQTILCCTDSIYPDSGGPNSKERAGNASIIHGAARRLTETTTLVLDLCPKMIRGGKIHTENIDLGQMTAELLEEFKPWLQREAGMELTSSLPEAPIRAKTNGVALSVILQNLLYNAGLYAATGKRAYVSLAENPADGTIELRVRDYGPGVPHGELKRIFTAQRRQDGLERGHGIGLPFSKSLARAVGGDLVCEIPADGAGGSIFILSLPKNLKQKGRPQ